MFSNCQLTDSHAAEMTEWHPHFEKQLSTSTEAAGQHGNVSLRQYRRFL